MVMNIYEVNDKASTYIRDVFWNADILIGGTLAHFPSLWQNRSTEVNENRETVHRAINNID